MIYATLVLLLLMRIVQDYFDSPPLYFMLENLMFLFFSIYAFIKEEKTVPILIVTACVWIFLANDFIDNALWLYDPETEYPFLYIFFNAFAVIDIAIILYEHRQKWKHIKWCWELIKSIKK